ncbi:DNA adenine methylase [Undibacterium danionis]|uniref:site-specific DNA-methyltransferase (adenine-specific) n=1 Tax=Undibacterium danionis TaxID=1812100 RepID=A0ABV6IFQ7_9BURK
MKTILRWSGSKTRLLPDLLKSKPKNYERYVEPFAGSASLFFSIEPNEAILGDLNTCVMEVYQAVRDDPTGVHETLCSIPKTKDAYYMLRGLSPSDLTRLQRAARLIFLMKACFNGVYRTNQLGQFNVPMGDKIYSLPSKEELLIAQSLLQRTQLYNQDFSKTTALCKPNDWVYFDPPYKAVKRYRGEYGYESKSHNVLFDELVNDAQRLAEIGCYVTISYAFDEELIGKFCGWNFLHVNARRSVSGSMKERKLAKELIIQNY